MPEERALQKPLTIEKPVAQPTLQDIKNRLQEHIDPPLNEIQWHLVGENRKKTPPALIKNEDKKEEKDLRTQAKEIFEDTKNPYIKNLVEVVPEFGNYNVLQFSRGNLPEELCLIIHQLSNFDIKNRPDVGVANIPTAIGTTFRILHGDKPLWRDLKQPLINNENCADEILKELDNKAKKAFKTIQEVDLHVCILSALACGDPDTALKLVEKAGTFLPQYGNDTAKVIILNELSSKSCFEEVYKFYPDSLKNNLDALLASLDENMPETERSDVAKRLRQHSEARLRTNLEKAQNLRDTSQIVKDITSFEQNLDKEHLAEIIENSLKSEEPGKIINNHLKENAEGITNGIVANGIAAELLRRMQPELSIEDQLKKLKMRETSKSNEQPENSTSNRYTPTIDKIIPSTDLDAANDIIFERMHELQYLVTLLKNPEEYISQFRRAIESVNKLKNPEYDKKAAVREDILPKKLIGGLNYLKALSDSDVPEINKIVQDEIGFGSLFNKDSLNNAIKILKEEFKDKVNVDEQQINEDMETTKQIANAIPADNKTIISEKKAATSEIISGLQAKANGEKIVQQGKQTSFNELASKKNELEDKLANPRALIKEIQEKINNMTGVGKKLFLNTTQNKLNGLLNEAKPLEDQLGKINEEIKQIGNIQEETNKIEQKITSLKRLDTFMNS